jgi:hypothetical protein
MMVLQSAACGGGGSEMRGVARFWCKRSHDDMFLECAALAKADLLVAADKDLLTLVAYK